MKGFGCLCASAVVLLSACGGMQANMPEAQAQQHTPPDQGMTIQDVLKQVRVQLAAARTAECDDLRAQKNSKERGVTPNTQKLNVYLDTVELHLDLKRDVQNKGELKVDLPFIGQFGPTGTYDRTVDNSVENTLIVKFAGIQPKAGTKVDPCDPDTTLEQHTPSVAK